MKTNFPVSAPTESTTPYSVKIGEAREGATKRHSLPAKQTVIEDSRRRGKHYFVDAVCDNCGRHYEARKDDVVSNRARFCGKSCHASVMARKIMGVSRQIQKSVYAEVEKAIESGKLIRQPCERCGELKTDAHHEDYGKSLDVIWLCRSCHVKRHLIRGGEFTFFDEQQQRKEK
jgi:ribosomal protein S27AE